MAELETIESSTSSCCSPSAQETCCEPAAKEECCREDHPEGCGCSAAASEAPDVQEAVRKRYAAAATAASSGEQGCCGEAAVITDDQREAFGSGLYASDERDALPEAAQLASLGCGNPTAVADLNEGETVLDLGSGGRHRRPDLGAARRADREGVSAWT